MWVKSVKSIQASLGGPSKLLKDLDRGEVFSLNAKSRKFVLDQINASKDQVMVRVAKELRPSQRWSYEGEEILSYASYGKHPVLVHGEAESLDNPLEPERRHELFDRIKMKANGVTGTIVDLNYNKPPDWDLIVLLDQHLDGTRVVEAHLYDFEPLGEKADNGLLEMARQAHHSVRDARGEHEEGYVDQTREVVQEELAKVGITPKGDDAHRAEASKRFEDRKAELAYNLAIKAAAEMKPKLLDIIEAGTLTVTVGEHNCELDRAEEIAGGYMEDIYNRVATLDRNHELVAMASNKIVNDIKAMIESNYYMTRFGFIRETPQGRWAVYTKAGRRLGIHAHKKKALSQLRAMEWRKRYGWDEPEEAL